MTQFLFTTLPSNDLGLLTRSLPIARELAQRGHSINFSSPAPAPSKLIAQSGFDNLIPQHPLFFLLASEVSLRKLPALLLSSQVREGYGNVFSFLWQLVRSTPTRLAPSTHQVWNMDHAGAMIGMLNRNFVRAACDAYISTVQSSNADVVIDFMNPFACIAARVSQKPLVTAIQVDAHPAGKGFIWWKEPPPNLPTPLPVVNKVLTGYGLRPVSKIEELSMGDLTLVIGTPETDPLPAGAEGTYIGPVLWQDQNATLPDWITKLKDDQPVIWIYPGNPRYGPVKTPADSDIVIRASIQALADQELQVILTTGHHALPSEYLPLPANFRHEFFVPGLAMAERSDLLIHHGGYGSCQTGLLTGTPAVIIPTFSERESNARRIAAVGAGDFLAPTVTASGEKSLSAADLRATVIKVLSDPAFAANAVQVSKILQAYGGPAYAADLIERFANQADPLG